MSFRRYSETEIKNLYKQFVVKDQAYYDKYKKVPLEKNDPRWPWDNHDYPRVVALLEFQEWIEKYNIGHFKKVLATCKTDPELKYITADRIDYYEYDEASGKNDLHTLNLPDKDYDFIIFTQTLEHLYQPQVAIDRLYDHLSYRGFIYTNWPTINIPHMIPYHYNGLTPMGALLLFISAGFIPLEEGHWGNFEYIQKIFATGQWPDYKELMHDGQIINDPFRQSQSWILCTK